MDTALIALAGLIGVIAGGLLQMRRGRIEQLRERQLVAADDFASAAMMVFITLSRKMEELGDADLEDIKPWLDGFAEAVAQTRDVLHELTARMSRLELLFGVGSPTASKAAETIGHLHRLTLEMQKDVRDPKPGIDAYEAAADAFGEFNRRAHQVMTEPGWRRWARQRELPWRRRPATEAPSLPPSASGTP